MANEINVLREFIVEFSPFYTTEMVAEMDYAELVKVAKEVAELL